MERAAALASVKIFAACAPGVEPILSEEIASVMPLPVAATRLVVPGGVEFEGDLSAVYRANFFLRTASRILVRLAEFPAVSWPELVRKASRLDWHLFVAAAVPLAFRVTCKASRLYHTKGVEERLLQAASKALGRPLGSVRHDEEAAEAAAEVPQIVVVRFHRNICTISMDASGLLLYKRGYKLETAKAPLRETLAAAALMAAGWDRVSPLVDPFCGSGTIPIEAALMARRMAPGLRREFAFMRWPAFDRALWTKVLKEAESKVRTMPSTVKIAGSDRDEGAVEASRANAVRAGLSAKDIVFERRTVSEAVPVGAGPGWVVTNPPYGIRLGGRDLRDLYDRFAAVLKGRFVGWGVGILAADRRLVERMGLGLEARAVFLHGGRKIGCYVGRVP